jgi:hypothetical protein
MRQLARVESGPPERGEGDRERGFWSKVKEVITGS